MIADTARSEVQGRPRRWAGVAGRAAGLLALLAALALLALVTATAALPLVGHPTTIIYGGSMAPAIDTGALAVSRPVDPQTLQVGDVISFRRSQAGPSVTHRIVAIRDVNGERRFTVKGDANDSPDPGEMSFSLDVNKVIFDVPYAGYVIDFVHSQRGMLLLPLIGLAALQVLGMGKGKRAKENARV